MGYIKIIVLTCLLFNLSNAVNVVKNTFSPNGKVTSCTNNGEEGYFNLKGSWENANIPNSLNFDLTFKDGNKFACTAVNKGPEYIRCPNARGNISSTVIDQYIDSNKEYFIKGGYKITYVCSSLNIYSNLLLLLFVIFFILF